MSAKRRFGGPEMGQPRGHAPPNGYLQEWPILRILPLSFVHRRTGSPASGSWDAMRGQTHPHRAYRHWRDKQRMTIVRRAEGPEPGFSGPNPSAIKHFRRRCAILLSTALAPHAKRERRRKRLSSSAIAKPMTGGSGSPAHWTGGSQPKPNARHIRCDSCRLTNGYSRRGRKLRQT